MARHGQNCTYPISMTTTGRKHYAPMHFNECRVIPVWKTSCLIVTCVLGLCVSISHIDISIYSFPEPRLTHDRSLTKVPPLYSPAKTRFVGVLALCSPLLPYCSPVLPRCSPVLPLSHFLLSSWSCCLISVNESVRSARFGY